MNQIRTFWHQYIDLSQPLHPDISCYYGVRCELQGFQFLVLYIFYNCNFQKMTTLLYFFLGLTLTLNSCRAYKALVVYPMPSRSHGNLGDALVKQLLKEGNEVCRICHLLFQLIQEMFKIITYYYHYNMNDINIFILNR